MVRSGLGETDISAWYKMDGELDGRNRIIMLEVSAEGLLFCTLVPVNGTDVSLEELNTCYDQLIACMLLNSSENTYVIGRHVLTAPNGWVLKAQTEYVLSFTTEDTEFILSPALLSPEEQEQIETLSEWDLIGSLQKTVYNAVTENGGSLTGVSIQSADLSNGDPIAMANLKNLSTDETKRVLVVAYYNGEDAGIIAVIYPKDNNTACWDTLHQGLNALYGEDVTS